MGKSKGKGVASSSSAPPPAKKLKGTARRDTLQVASPPDNISSNIFSFPREDDRVTWMVIQRKAIGAMSQIDWEAMEAEDWADGLRATLNRAGLLPLFHVTEPAYEWPTKELLSTFRMERVNERINSVTTTKCIYFRLGGIERSLTLDEFAIDLGFYTAEELALAPPTAIFRNTESTAECEIFWRTLAPSDPNKYDSSASKASMMERPIYRFLQLVFRESITHRLNSGGVCNARDLFIMRCIEEGRKVHLGSLVAKLFQLQRERATRLLLGGSYVTRLVHRYDVFASYGAIRLHHRIPQLWINGDLPRSKKVSDILAPHCDPYIEKRGRSTAAPEPEPEAAPAYDFSGLERELREMRADSDARWEATQEWQQESDERFTSLQELQQQMYQSQLQFFSQFQLPDDRQHPPPQ
ncbi:hypothetical protein LINPERHAP2_LOCUS11812 [Linum perenne]